MNNAVTISHLRQKTRERLRSVSTSARIDTDALLCHVLGRDVAWLIAHDDGAVDDLHLAQFNSLVNRRLSGEPIAYLTGYKEFWSLTLTINNDVLIPRAATETLVAQALHYLPYASAPSILELGTGSGAIAIALAKERPLARILATDIDGAALNVARKNARCHHADNIEFVQSDWFDNVPLEEFDAVVSNPPYVAENDDALYKHVKQFEPAAALFSGSDGLNAIRTICEHSPRFIKTDGFLLLEHGYMQHQAVSDIMARSQFRGIRCTQDLEGLDRVTSARKTRPLCGVDV